MAKGNSVELKTFKSYGVDEILGFKMEEKDGRTYMNFIWCKVYTRNEEGIKYTQTCEETLRCRPWSL